jgi:DNA ligase D-like protein (predicted 3'-phosphoesterase)
VIAAVAGTCRRDITQTREPTGETSIVATHRRRFVIQKHAATRLHYDLRPELGGVFKSWAATRGPSLDPADKDGRYTDQAVVSTFMVNDIQYDLLIRL